MNIFRGYNSLLLKYPWPTKCISAGFLFGLGDFITQKFITKNKEYDTYRTKKLALFGLLFAAPTLNIWYSTLIPKCTNFVFSHAALKPYASTNLKMFFGVFLDQTVFASLFLVSFFVIMEYADSRNLENAKKNLREKFWPTMIVNWKVWPAAQVINFGFVPLQFRVLYANTLGLFWNCYLSYAQYRVKGEDK